MWREGQSRPITRTTEKLGERPLAHEARGHTRIEAPPEAPAAAAPEAAGVGQRRRADRVVADFVAAAAELRRGREGRLEGKRAEGGWQSEVSRR